MQSQGEGPIAFLPSTVPPPLKLDACYPAGSPPPRKGGLPCYLHRMAALAFDFILTTIYSRLTTHHQKELPTKKHPYLYILKNLYYELCKN